METPNKQKHSKAELPKVTEWVLNNMAEPKSPRSEIKEFKKIGGVAAKAE